MSQTTANTFNLINNAMANPMSDTVSNSAACAAVLALMLLQPREWKFNEIWNELTIGSVQLMATLNTLVSVGLVAQTFDPTHKTTATYALA